MATFFMFGKYSHEALKEISAERTDRVVSLIKKIGGEVKSMHALLGENDLVFIVDLPGMEEALKTSVALSKLTGISFTTSQAVTVKEFDKIVSGI